MSMETVLTLQLCVSYALAFAPCAGLDQYSLEFQITVSYDFSCTMTGSHYSHAALAYDAFEFRVLNSNQFSHGSGTHDSEGAYFLSVSAF